MPLVLFLAGCGGTTTIDTSGSPYAGGAARYQLSTSSAGPIGADTPYSATQLARLFPGYRFDTVRTMTDGRVRHFLAGFDEDGLQAFQVEADRGRRSIEAVHVVGPAFAGPNGERIGQTYRETNGGRLACEAGRGQWTGMASCRNSGEAVEFIYSPELFSGAPGKLPSREELANARLVRMIWHAS